MKLPGRYYIYIVKCADESYYTGITNDTNRRVSEHNDGYKQSCYTYKRRPVELVYTELFRDVNKAIEREKQIKRWSRNKKEALIRGDITALEQHAMNTTLKAAGNTASEESNANNGK